ncbi:hypothetical protein [Mycobacterium sp. SMC-2]|uniref:hypothetical protein n=1 Tax=Mycobacterium sp. SMC-2 TaxID=2857058 RepID=UPI0021B45AF2|nr:hypothetical protein [Mycobacterium sp. SMC-2]
MAENMVNVPRTEIVRVLGLSADVDDKTLQRALEVRLAAIEADKGAAAVSAAEQRARAEDRSIVMAAYNVGKIPASRIEFWCDALQKDRAGNRSVIAALAPALPPREKLAADADLERTHRQVMARLGIIQQPPGQQPPRTVAAAARVPHPYDPSVRPPVDGLGNPLPGIPPPVRYYQGKDPSTWTPEEQSNWFMHRLGGRFAQGVPRPPRRDAWYQPTGVEPYEFDEASGEWRAKPNYQSRSDG